MPKPKAESFWFQTPWRHHKKSKPTYRPSKIWIYSTYPLLNLLNCKYNCNYSYELHSTCKRLLNKVSEVESGVHTTTLPHGEAHTSEGEQGPKRWRSLPPS